MNKNDIDTIYTNYSEQQRNGDNNLDNINNNIMNGPYGNIQTQHYNTNYNGDYNYVRNSKFNNTSQKASNLQSYTQNYSKGYSANSLLGQSHPHIVEEKIIKLNGEFLVISYLKGKFIGKGGFAKCYEFTNLQTKHRSAGKVVEKSSLTKMRAKQKLISEIKIHKSIMDDHIVRFEHYFEDSENVYILLELCQNQSLSELLKRRKRLTEFEAVYYLCQLIQALKYLHSQRIIHRDLKLGNLFLSEKMCLKVGDFGLATRLDYEGERKRTVCGTPNYIAPEILEGRVGHSYQVDIWAIGVILYTLLIGKPPFETNDVKLTYKKIKAVDYKFPEEITISEAAKSLISEILVTDPMKRPSLDEIMASSFMSGANLLPGNIATATIACPPSIDYIRQFWPKVNMKGEFVPENGDNTINAYDTFNFVKNKSKDKKKVIITKEIEIWQENKENEDPNEEELIKLKMRKPDVPPDHLYIVKSHTEGEVIVEKWVDYSSKYGIGYLLTNNSLGVYFNDSTKIILDPEGNVFHYLERRLSDKIEVMSTYKLNDYPKELNKKVILLQHFRNFLLNKDGGSDSNTKDNVQDAEKKVEAKYTEENATKTENTNYPTSSSTHTHNNFVYLKKWMKTNNSILFRLSNKIVQVTFNDKTQIILSSETKDVTYVDKEKKRIKMPIQTAMESNNKDMVKRLKYTKEVLSHALSLSKHPHAQASSSEANKENVPCNQ